MSEQDVWLNPYTWELDGEYDFAGVEGKAGGMPKYKRVRKQ